jgi:hypothetical protein
MKNACMFLVVGSMIASLSMPSVQAADPGSAVGVLNHNIWTEAGVNCQSSSLLVQFFFGPGFTPGLDGGIIMGADLTEGITCPFVPDVFPPRSCLGEWTAGVGNIVCFDSFGPWESWLYLYSDGATDPAGMPIGILSYTRYQYAPLGGVLAYEEVYGTVCVCPS